MYFISDRLFLLFICSEYAPLKPKKRDNKDNMADAIFMAKKKRNGKDDGDDDDDEGEDDDNKNTGKGRELVSQVEDDDYDPSL